MQDIEDTFKTPKPLNYINDQEKMRDVVREFVKNKPDSKKKLSRLISKLQKEYKISLGYANILYTYKTMVDNGDIEDDEEIRNLLMAKKVRFLSGVNVITIMTSAYPGDKEDGRPEKFSCPYDCHYCPDETPHVDNNWTHQPRSYLFNEPSVRRANRNYFDTVLQFRDRATSYYVNGHPLGKCEIIVLGGTWSSYPDKYKDKFIRDVYYAANTFFDSNNCENLRERLSIKEEQKINETAKCRIIGLTIETRSDKINKKEIITLRKYGVTRIQLGVQHTDDDILKYINRQCPTKITKKAIKLLKDNCFKVDIHLMPDLPSSNPEKDFEMFCDILYDPDLQVDQWKIYPCEIVPWTKIKLWYEQGLYKPYAEKNITVPVNYKKEKIESTPLFELLINIKNRVHPWIRLNRVIRDIPGDYIIGGNKVTNLRQFLQQELHRRGQKCDCIRCREVKDKDHNVNEARLVVRQYDSSNGLELFLSYETTDILFGFLRLRLPNDIPVFKELENAAFVRELHVYGKVTPVAEKNDGNTQHYGFGNKLMIVAEHIAKYYGYNKLAVISGVGVKEYYKNKLGYSDEGYFQTKLLTNFKPTLQRISINYYNFVRKDANYIVTNIDIKFDLGKNRVVYITLAVILLSLLIYSYLY
mgnify:CR=1 FL=1